MRNIHHRQIYAQQPLRGLQEAQLRVLLPELQRCAGDHALLVTTPGCPAPPALPLLPCWMELRVEGARYSGDLCAATHERLPFIDDAFDVVWLRHALEILPQADEVLQESIRVLAPGGTLVIAGVHPLSVWGPWFHWKTHDARNVLHSPLQLSRTLREGGLDVLSTRRVGGLWPMAGRSGRADVAPWGGGYVLVARKQHCLVTPLQVNEAPIRMPAGSRLAPSARRSTAA